jgi:hypothetical protein
MSKLVAILNICGKTLSVLTVVSVSFIRCLKIIYMFTQPVLENFFFVSAILSIVFIIAYFWAGFRYERDKEKKAKEESKKIGDATGVELLSIAESIITLEKWNDSVEKSIKAQILQLLDHYEAHMSSDVKKEVSEDRAYRKDLQERYLNIGSLITLLDMLELNANAERAEKLFDTLTALTPAYLEAIKWTKTKDDLREFLIRGYITLSNARSLEDEGKKMISSAVRTAEQAGMPKDEIEVMVEMARRGKLNIPGAGTSAGC